LYRYTAARDSQAPARLAAVHAKSRAPHAALWWGLYKYNKLNPL
jgi:hypothetical protein